MRINRESETEKFVAGACAKLPQTASRRRGHGARAVAEDAGASSGKNNKPSTSLGFESKLWAMADKLRSKMDAADYKHIVLGLIFLKFIYKSEAKRAELAATPNADPEERD